MWHLLVLFFIRLPVFFGRRLTTWCDIDLFLEALLKKVHFGLNAILVMVAVMGKFLFDLDRHWVQEHHWIMVVLSVFIR